MNEKHMQYVLTVLKEGSFTKAAKKLYVSQPSLSQAVKSAEAALGAPIFNRNTDPVTLTPAGVLYVEAARKIQTISSSLSRQIEELGKEETGTIRLGISVQRGMELLPFLYPRFKARFPRVELKLLEQGSAAMEQSVLEGAVDLALLTTFPKYDELVYELIQTEKLVLLAGKNTELAKRLRPGTPVDIREAKDEVFLLSKEGHSVRTILDSLFAARGMKPKVGLETVSIEVGKRVVAESPLVMACPDVYAGTDNSVSSPYFSYPVLGVETPRHFYACYRKDLYLPRYIRYFLGLLQAAGKLPAGRAPGTDTDAAALTGIPVGLSQMLDAREQRAALQQRFLKDTGCPLVSLTLNIPGPIKVLPLVPEAFSFAVSRIGELLTEQGWPVVQMEQILQSTGLEAMWAVKAGPLPLKAAMTAFEDAGDLGRLYDIDVLDRDGTKLSREDMGLPPRKCLLCEKPAHSCARSRAHTVDQLTERIEFVLRKEFLHHGI